MRKKILTTTLLLTLLSGAFSFKSFLKTEALTARAINVTNQSIAAVRSYYSALNSKSESERKGEALLTSLKPILKNDHQSFSYATVWDWSKVTDRDWNLSPMTQAQLNSYNFGDDPYVKLLYRSDNGTATASKHQDSHTAVLNREHVWPKSLGNFGETAPAGTDLHHLILADAKNNNAHNNNPYGNVNPSKYNPIANYVGDFTGKTGTINYLGNSYTVYEPQDIDKGDIARAMFYMAARYSSYTSVGDPYLRLTNTPNTVTTPSNATTPGQGGLLDTLLTWHNLDPVDDYEIRRNNLIYNNAQFNRNPFIDYPSWVDAVWGSKTPANPLNDYVSQFGQIGEVEPTSITLSPSSLSLNVGGSQTLSLNVSPANASKSVTWTSSNNNVATVSSSGLVTAVTVGTTTITAKSTLNQNIKGTATITVTTAATLSSLSVSSYNPTVKLTEPYNNDNTVVTAHYSDGGTLNVTNSAIIETPDTTRLGKQSLIVSYSEAGITRVTDYEVKVTNNGVDIGNIPTLATDLFISEYIEPAKGEDKAIEIYNGTGSSVSLEDYSLKIYFNANTTAGGTLTLSGMLAHGSTYTIVRSSAQSSLQARADLLTNSNVLTFNGDDAVGLYKDGVIIDRIGVQSSFAVQTGVGADGLNLSTQDMTLVRSSSVISPNITFTPSEWIGTKNTSTVVNIFLGSHIMTATSPGISKELQANAWAEYFLDVTSVYCEDLNGALLAGSLWNELGQEYSYMDSTTKALYATTPSNSDTEGVGGAKARYLYLITKYSTLKSNNFMKDGANNVIFNINGPVEKSNNQNNSALVILISLSALLFSFYFLTKKKRDISR